MRSRAGEGAVDRASGNAAPARTGRGVRGGTRGRRSRGREPAPDRGVERRDERRRRISSSTRAWRAACRTTPGAIMEIAVPDLAGSLGGGGRYDGLIGMFSGEDFPACGFSLGLERILVVMTRAQHVPGERAVGGGGRAGDAVRRGGRDRRAAPRRRASGRGASRRGLPGSRQAGQAVQVRGGARPSRSSPSSAATSARPDR